VTRNLKICASGQEGGGGWGRGKACYGERPACRGTCRSCPNAGSGLKKNKYQHKSVACSGHVQTKTKKRGIMSLICLALALACARSSSWVNTCDRTHARTGTHACAQIECTVENAFHVSMRSQRLTDVPSPPLLRGKVGRECREVRGEGERKGGREVGVGGWWW